MNRGMNASNVAATIREGHLAEHARLQTQYLATVSTLKEAALKGIDRQQALAFKVPLFSEFGDKNNYGGYLPSGEIFGIFTKLCFLFSEILAIKPGNYLTHCYLIDHDRRYCFMEIFMRICSDVKVLGIDHSFKVNELAGCDLNQPHLPFECRPSRECANL